jgi:hypothetical protein
MAMPRVTSTVVDAGAVVSAPDLSWATRTETDGTRPLRVDIAGVGVPTSRCGGPRHGRCGCRDSDDVRPRAARRAGHTGCAGGISRTSDGM